MDEAVINFQHEAWSLEWAYFGEGYSEDYNPKDPDDRQLLRATLLFDGGELERGGSFCTLATIDTPTETLRAYSRDLFECLPPDKEDYYRLIMEKWTWRTNPDADEITKRNYGLIARE